MKPLSRQYLIKNSHELVTPALVVFPEIIEMNIKRMIKMCSDPLKLRPHVKTYKMAEVVKLQLNHGIKKFKAATFAESEMVAEAGGQDILLAYHIVGPNIQRAVNFVKKYPDVNFMVIADHIESISQLNKAMVEAGETIEVLLDIDTGLHRTGVEPGDQAFNLYKQIDNSQGVKAGGFHVYDGHLHQSDRKDRAVAVHRAFQKVSLLRDELVNAGLKVPRLVCGGTATFPIYAEMNDPFVEYSPGTCIFHDVGYGTKFPDLHFTPAAVILTRVISLPGQGLVTLDLGCKAVASDPLMTNRVVFPQLPDAELVLQNEEHLVIKTTQASQLKPSNELIGIPWHICPTTALNKEVGVVQNNYVQEFWKVVARDRTLNI